jgi:glycosyltransferase involved in cell wall biosynthesis
MTRRFCFLTTFYPPWNFGGDGLNVQRLAHALARRGHEVTVIHDADAYDILYDGPKRRPEGGPHVEAGERKAEEPPGVRVVTLRSRLPLASTLLTQQLGRPVVNAPRLRTLIAEGRFDVVNFHNVSLIGGPGLLAFGAASIRLYLAHEHWLVCPTHVLWRHNRELCDGRECVRCQLHYGRPPQLWRHTGLLARHLDDVDVFLAMSEFSRDKHREFGFTRPMQVLPPFVPDPEPLSARSGARPHDRPYFFFAGRLERIKGLDDVIPVIRDYTGADLLIAGDGDHAPALRALSAGNPRVRFLGRVPPEALDAYYRHAIAGLAPSVCFETFGNTLVEAFRHGTPVIARRLGPFPEIVDRSGGGMLFDTVAELQAAMHALQSNPAHRDQMGLAGFEACRAFWSESAVLPQYLGIVERAIEARTQAVH